MHSSQFGITFADLRGPVNSDGPIHCIRSLNWMVRYSVMPLPAIVRLATNRFSTRCTKGSEGSVDEGVGERVSFTRLDTDDDSPVVNASGNSEVGNGTGLGNPARVPG